VLRYKFSEFSNLSEIQHCVKCAQLEIQLQQILNELNSVEIIIQMLNKEQVEEDAVAISIQQMETKWEVNYSWNVVTIRSPKR
jgi:hypothetical protein